MKVREVPCLCPHCIADDGECDNYAFTDKWRTVNLVPIKGENMRKHEKRPDPRRNTCTVRGEEDFQCEMPSEDTSAKILEIEDEDNENEDTSMTVLDVAAAKEISNNEDSIFIDLTAGVGKADDFEDLVEIQDNKNDADVEIIDFEEAAFPVRVKTEEASADDSFPEDCPKYIFWQSILSRFENCINFEEFNEVVEQVFQNQLKPIEGGLKTNQFNKEADEVDNVAQQNIPTDGPSKDAVYAVKTRGDGNCLPRALSKAYFGTDARHLEVRARIVIEGIVNAPHYLHQKCLERGAINKREMETIPKIYASYSDFYVSGQKITDNTVEYMYWAELKECSKGGSYMGLWQLAQASQVFRRPIHSVYPHVGDQIMRNDFHRTFFPLRNADIKSDEDPLIIMWTPVANGFFPVHFVPLLRKFPKYTL